MVKIDLADRNAVIQAMDESPGLASVILSMAGHCQPLEFTNNVWCVGLVPYHRPYYLFQN
jgi:hypothetical protein